MLAPYRPDRILAAVIWVKAALSAITGAALIQVAGRMGSMARHVGTSEEFLRGFPAKDQAAMRADDATMTGFASTLGGMFVLFAVVMFGVALIEIAMGVGVRRGRRRAFRWGVGLESALILLSLLFFSAASLLGIALSLGIAVASFRRLRGHGPAPIAGRVVESLGRDGTLTP